MSAIRYSGQIKIRITYLKPYGAGDACPAGHSTHPNGEYRCFLRAGDQKITVYVGAPAFLSHAVDSPEAFDGIARAAVALADATRRRQGPWRSTRWSAFAADGSDRHVGRSPSQAWPNAKAV
jgi:hypothetical protein